MAEILLFVKTRGLVPCALFSDVSANKHTDTGLNRYLQGSMEAWLTPISSSMACNWLSDALLLLDGVQRISGSIS